MEHAAALPAEAVSEKSRAMRWRVFGFACALCLASGLAYLLVRMPFQIDDNLENLLSVQDASWPFLLQHQFIDPGPYFRPLLWVVLKAVFTVSGGAYFAVYKAIHVLQVVALLLLVVRLFRVSTSAEAALVPIALAVLVGLHTFSGLVREGFPINHYMTIAVCCAAALNLAVAARSCLVDAGILAVSLVASLTMESGLLVCGIFFAGYLAGMPGVSRRAAVGILGVVIAYFAFRFAVTDGSLPQLVERSSGYGFHRLDPPELMRRFGERPLVFYAYNVACSLLSVLLSEPREGMWEFARSYTQGSIEPWRWINVLASMVTTAAIAGASIAAVRRRRSGAASHHEQLLFVCLAVIVANAVLSYPYTKDVMVSPAGVCYAIAAYIGFLWAVDAVRQRRLSIAAAVAATVLLGGVSAAWASRVVSLGGLMRLTAFQNRNDWVEIERWLANDHKGTLTASNRQLVQQLRDEVLGMAVPIPEFARTRFDAYLESR